MATFTTDMRPDGYWKGQCPAGVVVCTEGAATFSANGIGNTTETGGVMFHGGYSFETTSAARSELNGKYYVCTYEPDPEGNAGWNMYHCV